MQFIIIFLLLCFFAPWISALFEWSLAALVVVLPPFMIVYLIGLVFFPYLAEVWGVIAASVYGMYYMVKNDI